MKTEDQRSQRTKDIHDFVEGFFLWAMIVMYIISKIA